METLPEVVKVTLRSTASELSELPRTETLAADTAQSAKSTPSPPAFAVPVIERIPPELKVPTLKKTPSLSPDDATDMLGELVPVRVTSPVADR